MTFPDWLEDEHLRMSDEYRTALDRKCAEFERVTTMFKPGQAHIDIAIECLREVKIPAIGKYPNATEADKEYFKTARKPLWYNMLNDAIKRVEEIKTASGYGNPV